MGEYKRRHARRCGGGLAGRQGGEFSPFRLSSPPSQPHSMNGAVYIPHTALFGICTTPFSFSCHPSLSPLILLLIILYVLLELNIIIFFQLIISVSL